MRFKEFKEKIKQGEWLRIELYRGIVFYVKKNELAITRELVVGDGFNVAYSSIKNVQFEDYCPKEEIVVISEDQKVITRGNIVFSNADRNVFTIQTDGKYHSASFSEDDGKTWMTVQEWTKTQLDEETL